MDKSVIVRLKDIVMNFDDEQVLKGIDLDIHDKEFIPPHRPLRANLPHLRAKTPKLRVNP